MVFCVGFLNVNETKAGTVRTVYSNGVTMLPIFLRMGQSTVLRFSEKPKKVILGNSNYYSVEFVDNDLAIQPLGAVTTNLFVYGVQNVYGFLLRTNVATNYDDLVQVTFKESPNLSRENSSVKRSFLKVISNPGINFQVGDALKITLSRIQKLERNNLYVMDVMIENISKSEIDISKIEMNLSHGKIKLSPQEIAIKDPLIKSSEITVARLFVLIAERTDLNFAVLNKNLKGRLIISRRFL